MHPILFSIPLPKTQVQAQWFYLAIIALGLLYAAVSFFVQKDRANAVGGVVVAGVGGLAWATHSLEKLIADKDTPAGMIPVGPLPIYSYGVMLGLSLVVGWYLTLGLAKRDGLPQETMANNYVITAVAAIAGSRVLYVLTNLNEFDSPVDIFALRRGGLVAYGGFLGGFLGSLFYLRKHKIPLLPWADVAVPSLASGLMITRIGCYLFGCDFGQVLCGAKGHPECTAPTAPPHWLQTLGTFPRWMPGLLHEGQASEGAPAWTHHVKHAWITQADGASLPVHPTQLYESLLGACLLALLLFARTKQKFRGQIFLLFTFAYGVARYLIEILRDDEERGSLPFSGGKHTIVALGLVIFGAGFALGFSQLIKDLKVRRVAQVLGFVPAVILYFVLMPSSWDDATQYQWSTSQFVGLTTGFAACVAFSVFYKAALAHPEAAMRIPLPETEEGTEGAASDENVADDDDEEEEAAAKKPAAKKPAPKKEEAKKEEAPKAKAKSAGRPVKKAAAKKPAPKPKAEDDEAGEDADGESEAPAKAKSEEAEAGEKAADDKADEKKADEKKDADEEAES